MSVICRWGRVIKFVLNYGARIEYKIEHKGGVLTQDQFQMYTQTTKSDYSTNKRRELI